MDMIEFNPLSSLLPLQVPNVVAMTALATERRFNLRTRTNSLAAVSEAFAIALPDRMGDTSNNDGRCAICVGPDEWLISVAMEEGGAICKSADDVAVRVPLSLVEITDRECALRLDGPKAAYILKAACPIDVAAMQVGSAKRTLFDQADVLILRESEAAFRIQMLRSWAVHVCSLLAIVSREVATGL